MMKSFHVGDVVRFLRGGSARNYSENIPPELVLNGIAQNVGQNGEVVWVNDNYKRVAVRYNGVNGVMCLGFDYNEVELVTRKNTNKNMPSLIEKAALAFKKEPEKSFIKVGILDSSEIPTDEGVKLWVAWQMRGNAADQFKTDVVDPILADIESDKK